MTKNFKLLLLLFTLFCQIPSTGYSAGGSPEGESSVNETIIANGRVYSVVGKVFGEDKDFLAKALTAREKRGVEEARFKGLHGQGETARTWLINDKEGNPIAAAKPGRSEESTGYRMSKTFGLDIETPAYTIDFGTEEEPRHVLIEKYVSWKVVGEPEDSEAVVLAKERAQKGSLVGISVPMDASRRLVLQEDIEKMILFSYLVRHQDIANRNLAYQVVGGHLRPVLFDLESAFSPGIYGMSALHFLPEPEMGKLPFTRQTRELVTSWDIPDLLRSFKDEFISHVRKKIDPKFAEKSPEQIFQQTEEVLHIIQDSMGTFPEKASPYMIEDVLAIRNYPYSDSYVTQAIEESFPRAARDELDPTEKSLAHTLLLHHSDVRDYFDRVGTTRTTEVPEIFFDSFPGIMQAYIDSKSHEERNLFKITDFISYYLGLGHNKKAGGDGTEATVDDILRQTVWFS